MIVAFERVRTAAATDPAAVAELIDWPVSGAARLVRAAAAVDPLDRREIVGRGVAELFAASRTRPVELLGTEAAYLNERPTLEPATPAENEEIRRVLRVGPLPAEITETDRAFLEHLVKQSVSITDTAVLRFAGNHAWGLAVGAFDRVAVARGLTDVTSIRGQ